MHGNLGRGSLLLGQSQRGGRNVDSCHVKSLGGEIDCIVARAAAEVDGAAAGDFALRDYLLKFIVRLADVPGAGEVVRYAESQ